MLTIRFNRVGKKNKAYFRIALQEHTEAPGGHHIEMLGSYDPHLKKAVLKAERIKYWIQKGAQCSDSAYNLFIKEGVLEGKKRAVKMPKKTEEVKTEEALKGEVKTEAATETKNEESKIEEIKSEPVDAKAIASEEKKEEKNPEDKKEEPVIDKK